MTLKSIFSLVLILLMSLSCKRDPLDVDVSKSHVNIDFINLDSVFVHATPSELMLANGKYKQEIESIYYFELVDFLGIGLQSDSIFAEGVKKFVSDPYISRVEKRIHSKFGNLKKQKERVIDGFKRLKFHFTAGKIPEHIVFMNSFFAANAFCTEKEIGVGLERYLGKKTDVIKELPPQQFFEWIKEGMEADFMERDILCSWIMTHYVPEVDGTLAEGMIRWGKIMYLTEASFPEMEKHRIIRYSKVDYEWALKNELSFWNYLVNEKFLFKTDERDKSNMLGDAPFTVGLPEKGPDRLGQFLGWRMVRNYMNKNEITLKALIDIPYNEILQEFEITD
jgi:hypothetical protein